MEGHQVTIDSLDQRKPPSTSRLDLSVLPPVFVLDTHLQIGEQHEAEDALSNGGAPLTYDIKEANLVLTKVTRERRAKSELSWKGVIVEDIDHAKERRGSESSTDSQSSVIFSKRRKLDHGKQSVTDSDSDATVDDNGNDSETEDDKEPDSQSMSRLGIFRKSTSSTEDSQDSSKTKEASPSHTIDIDSFTGHIKVVKLDWLTDSLQAGKILDIKIYIIYAAKLVFPHGEPTGSSTKHNIPDKVVRKVIAVADKSNSGDSDLPKVDQSQRFLGHDRKRNNSGRLTKQSPPVTRPSQLLHQTTSEHDEAVSTSLPPMPDWVLQNKIYACERATPLRSPNDDFICQLKKIKTARLLTLDEIGVRAYSTSIASLAAYPHGIQSTREILALPGCDQKIGHLFHEWQSNDGHIREVAEIEADAELSVLQEFYEIWGIGAKTARDFYDKGWRDLDDIVEHGWKSLSRVQQIGVKYYDEFLLRISRIEVESIAATISKHAKLVTDSEAQTVIVGGYRRGKSDCGDVDVILSHRDPAMTSNLIDRIVNSLEKEGWITHTLTLNLTNTKRGQEPLPINTATQVGHGFDTLDKALIVWQNPDWPTKDADLAANPKAKNPNPHRRVDIIISPWRTVGCAIAGWTSGTTFQRDLRRYAKYAKGWKFDSSGVRERGTGRWIDLERWTDPKTRCRDPEEAERRVFDGLGLVYREPWDRCTG